MLTTDGSGRQRSGPSRPSSPTKQASAPTETNKHQLVSSVELRGEAGGQATTSSSLLTGGHTKKAGIWVRVSTGHQEGANQVPELEQFCARHGFELAVRYQVSESAWRGGKDGGEYQRMLKTALDDAWAGRFDVLVVWALDRITREGAEGALRIIRQFRERRCTVLSVRESWLNGSPEVQDVLVAFAGWMAAQESTRRSERIRAGLARRAAEGKPLGRAAGAKDRKPRRRSGYIARWERERTG
jgi:DNA invertase Pin-like site-specific DNA recombinase